MFSKQSQTFLTPEEKKSERLALWNGAVRIVKAVTDAHLVGGREDCGWRGDHRDVAVVANYLSTMNPNRVHEHVAEAAAWLNSDRARDPNGLRIRHDHTVVTDLLGHLKRKFPYG